MREKPLNRKAILIGMLGNGLEWYDYALYGYMASVFAKLFFPSGDAGHGLILAYLTFAAGFIARPIGAVLFGMIGDTYGRKRALSASMILMAVPTGCIALLPGYAQIGAAAPVLLTVIRLLQGLSLGGAFSGAMSYLVEHAPPSRRASIGSLTIMSLVLGFLTGSLVAALTSALLSDADFLAWGWRVPFALGVVIGPVGFYLNHKGEESPEYVASAAAGQVRAASPVRQAFFEHPEKMLAGFTVYLCVTVPFYLLGIYLLTFTEKHLGFGRNTALGINALAMITLFASIWPFARLADRIGVLRSAIGASVLMAAVTLPAFTLLNRGDLFGAAAGQMLLAVALGAYAAPIPALLSRLFPAHIRCTGMAVSYNFCAVVGGFVPSAAEKLIEVTGSRLSIAPLPIVAALLSLAALLLLRSGERRDAYAEHIAKPF